MDLAAAANINATSDSSEVSEFLNLAMVVQILLVLQQAKESITSRHGVGTIAGRNLTVLEAENIALSKLAQHLQQQVSEQQLRIRFLEQLAPK